MFKEGNIAIDWKLEFAESRGFCRLKTLISDGFISFMTSIFYRVLGGTGYSVSVADCVSVVEVRSGVIIERCFKA